MQPNSTLPRPGHMPPIRGAMHAALALSFALALAAVPISRVAACMCASGELPDAIHHADVAFVGVAQAMAEGPPADNQRRNLYRFSVERASRQTGATIEVAAWAGSDAGCGIEFEIGERWIVLATRWEGALDTNACTGNLRVDDLVAAERADLPRLLPVVPDAAPEPTSAALERALPAIAIGLVVVALVATVAGVGAVTGRRKRDSAP
jgi:hypothetical protein